MAQSLVATFSDLKDIPRGESVTTLLYGYSGAGKTRFAGTAGDRTLFINNGAGITTLQAPLFQRQIGANPIIATLGINETANDDDVHDAICDTIDHALKTFPERFDTIVIDDSTQLRKGALAKALVINGSTNKSQSLKASELHGIPMPAVQDYGMEMNIIDHFVAEYTSICKANHKHLILCAHVRNTFKKSDRIGDAPALVKVQPFFTGVDKSPDIVTGYFDNVWYIEVVGGGNQRVHRITTVGNEIYVAKTREAGVFEVVETNPHFLKMLERIKNASKDNLAKGTKI